MDKILFELVLTIVFDISNMNVLIKHGKREQHSGTEYMSRCRDSLRDLMFSSDNIQAKEDTVQLFSSPWN